MTMRVRASLMLIVALGVMGLASCGHYTCGATFGSSTCTPSAPGIGSGGGGTNATVFAFHVDQVGSIDGYTYNATAKTFVSTSNYTAPQIGSNQGSIGIVTAQKKYLYAVFADQQKIYGWSIDSTGNLAQIGGLPLSVSLSGVPSVTYNQVVVITNPAGTLLFVSNTFASQILVYQIGSGGALTAAPGSPFTTGNLPQNMGMDGLGKYLYVSENDGFSDHGSIGMAAYNVSSSGVLSLIASYPAFPMWETQGDPTGQFLIGITGQTAFTFGSDDDHVYVFSIDSTGALTQVTNSPFATATAPFNAYVQPAAANGAFIYALGDTSLGTSTPLEGFQLNTGTGALTALASSNVSSAPIGQFDQSGNYFFLYTTDGHFSSLTSFQVTGSGGLTLGPGVTLATSGYFAIVDAQ